MLTCFVNDPSIVKTIEKDPTKSQEEALIEISKRLRPGEVFNLKAIKKDLEKRFYSTRRYDITGVGRYKFNQKLSLANRIEGKTLAEVKADLVAGKINVFDTAAFTVGGETLTSYIADVDTDANYEKDTEVVENGIFYESKHRSAPYFDARIDGITLLDEKY